MKKRTLILLLGAAALVALWAAFRPERLFINHRVNETSPSASPSASASSEAPTPLVAGQFHSVLHEGQGTATILQLPDGKKVLRLTNFKTSNGPDLQVYLVAAKDATDNETVTKSGFLTIAPLKGNEGDQNYDIPTNADLTKYRAVTIWCRRFGFNFATAPLENASAGETGAASTSKSIAAAYVGQFHNGSHQTEGTATIYQFPDGKQVIRLTNFKTSNGPDLQVYLIAAKDATDNDTVKKAGFVTLGALKGNEGDQNYEIPSGTDLAKYQAVTIWCRRFGFNFGTAPLVQQ